MTHRLLPSALLFFMAAPAAAGGLHSVDLPAGTLGAAVGLLGRQTGSSIAVADAALWQRPVPAMEGRMSSERAVARLAASAGAEARPAGRGAWRLIARPASPSRPAPPPASGPAPAQVEAADIVVTASKRDLPLAAYAGQVSRIAGAELTLAGLGGTDAVVERLATLTSTHLGSGRNKLFIRGIADSSFTGPTQSTVGQYLGDLRLGYNAPDPDLKLYDVAAVEVLEGPQGTLYGAGSLGGIVRVDPAAPVPGVVEGSLAAGASIVRHGDAGGDLGGMLNLPLGGEHATLRVVGYGVTDGGYIDNPVLGQRDINRTRVAGGRATLRLLPGDGWTVDVGGVLQRTKGDDSQYADRDGPRLSRASPVEQGFEARYTLGQVVVGKARDGLSLRSTTGIIRQHLTEAYDAGVPRGFVLPGTGTIRAISALGAIMSRGEPRVFRQRNSTRLLTHETRLWQPMEDGFGWVLGASYTDNRTVLTRAVGAVGAPARATGVVNRVREGTVYGEASWEPRPDLTLTAGARATQSRLTGDAIAPGMPLGLVAQPETVAARNQTSLLPAASALLRVAPAVRVFARYQQGFRPGGLAVEGDFVRRFDNDRIRSIEAGIRMGDPGLGPVDLTASVSHTRWNDIQADFIDAFGLPSTANIGDGRILTISATGAWQPAPSLRLELAATWNDSAVSDPDPLLTVALGRMSKVPNVASVSARGGIDWLGRAAGVPLRIAGWVRYIGPSRLGIGPMLGDRQGDYVDSALHARLGGPWLGLTLGVTNLADTVGNRFALGTPFAIDRAQITPLRPRTLRIGIDAAF